MLRGPDHLRVWERLLAGMGVDRLPLALQGLLRSTPHQELLLGHWRELLETPTEQLRAGRTHQLEALHESGTSYHHVSRAPLDPAHLAWLRTHLPEVGATVLAGSGHFPHLAQPEALVTIISGWR